MTRSTDHPPERSTSASDTAAAMRASLERQMQPIPTADDIPGAHGVTRPTFPDHELLYRIGIGAYGEVWLARNALGTLRAVKIVYRLRFEDDRPYQREFNGILKYEPISRTHPGLVQVLHVGRNDDGGCFYYVMELADPAVASSESPVPNPKSAVPPEPVPKIGTQNTTAGRRIVQNCGHSQRTHERVSTSAPTMSSYFSEVPIELLG